MTKSIEILLDMLKQIDIKYKFEIMPDGSVNFTFILPTDKKEWLFIVDAYDNTNQIRLRTFYNAPANLNKQQILRAINELNKELPCFKLYYQESIQGKMIFIMYTMPSIESGFKYYCASLIQQFFTVEKMI